MKALIKSLLCIFIIFGGLAGAKAQSSPKKYLSATGTNSNLVQAGSTLVWFIVPINTTATVYYLKLYNKATAPTCGTDTPLLTFPVPSNSTSGGGLVLSSGGLPPIFPLGLGFCLTGGIADNDTTAAAAGVAINFGFTGSP